MLRDLSIDERLEYFRGVHPIWGGGLDEARFLAFQRRLADSPEAEGRYRLLGWFEDGQLCAAMKTYALRATCEGRALRLLGIGAVFTPPRLRRRGHAAAMLEASLEAARKDGVDVAMLFSDIGAAYYERLGFRRVESRECHVAADDLPRASGGVRPAMAGDEALMTALFDSGRARGTRFSLVRDGWTLRLQLRRLRELARARGMGEPEWGMLAGEEGAAMIRFSRDTVDVLDAAFRTERARTQLLGALRECCLRSGRGALRLWPSHQLRDTWRSEERQNAIAMLAPLSPRAMLPDAGAANEITLLDHI